MCRLLGVVATRPGPIAALLKDDLEAFRGLAEEHGDGWGMAVRTRTAGADEAPVRKAAESALHSEAFRAAVGAAHGDAALLHLRKASQGMANTVANTHPFTADGVSFAHNGWVSPLPVLDGLVEGLGAGPCTGTTDSERYFRLVLGRLGGLGPVGALAAAAASIRSAGTQLESLNALLLTADGLYAVAGWDEDVVRGHGTDPASYGLSYRVTPAGVTVASNGWEQPSPAWRPLPNGSVLEVRRTGTGRPPVAREHRLGVLHG